MSLFSTDYQPDLAPYYSNPNSDPKYRSAMAKEKSRHTGAEAGFGIGEGVLSVLGAIFPMFAPLTSAGVVGLQQGDKAYNQKYNAGETAYQKSFAGVTDKWKQNPHGINPNATSTSPLTNFGSLLSNGSTGATGLSHLITNTQNKNIFDSMNKAVAKEPVPYFNTATPSTDKLLNADGTEVQAIGSNTDLSAGDAGTTDAATGPVAEDLSGSGTGIADVTGFKKGGRLMITDSGVSLFNDGGLADTKGG